jgi:hypothetical protein
MIECCHLGRIRPPKRSAAKTKNNARKERLRPLFDVAPNFPVRIVARALTALEFEGAAQAEAHCRSGQNDARPHMSAKELSIRWQVASFGAAAFGRRISFERVADAAPQDAGVPRRVGQQGFDAPSTD